MKTAMRKLHLKARAYHRGLMVSGSIADLAGSEGITKVDFAEPLQYRPQIDLV